MSALRRCLARLASVIRPGAAEDGLAREIASHVALLEDEYRRRGLSAGEARRAARIALGGVEQTKELHRDARSFRWLDDARRDVGYAFRVLRRNPVAAATIVLSLAIGIGANTAVFTVANALLMSGPPGVEHPNRLVDIGVSRGDGGFNPTSYPTYLDVRDRANTLAGSYAQQMFPQALSLLDVGTTGTAEQVFGQFVTSNYFAVLGVRASTGRLFDGADGETPGASPFVVLSDRYWASRFHRDAAVVGRVVRLNGHPFTIVGIAPAGFQGTGVTAADLWIPLNMLTAVSGQSPAIFGNAQNAWLLIGARLRPGISVEAAQAELDVLAPHVASGAGSTASRRGLRVLRSSLVPGNRGAVAVFVVLLMGMASSVLLVACANVSGILLARAAARRREIAVRLSIGAGRTRLVRQLLTETIVTFVLGGVVGVGLARALMAILVDSLPALPFPILFSVALDTRVLAFTAVISLLAAIASGLAPALQTANAQAIAALKDDSSGSTPRSRLRGGFVVAQVALSVALVVAAGLFARALARAGAVDPGFDPSGLELTFVDLSMGRYTETTGPAFWRRLLERAAALPGVESATVARVVPGGFEGIGLGLWPVGVRPVDDDFEADGNIVEPGYFSTLRIPIVAGRDFNTEDRPGAVAVAIVGEAAARHFWPGESALGKYLARRVIGSTRTYRVVGVVRDIKSTSLVDGMSQSFVYLPLQQAYAADLTAAMTLVIRTRGGATVAPATRSLVSTMDPTLPAATTRSLQASIALGLLPQRIALSLAGTLGAIGLWLAAVGIYGLTAYSVARRLREFGIRTALGARRRHIAAIVVREGLMPTIAGCAIGVALAAAAAHVMARFLLGVPGLDAPAFAGAVALFLLVGALACYGPARRATGFDVMSVLRTD